LSGIYKLEIQVLAWDRHKKCGGVKLVNAVSAASLMLTSSSSPTDK
jgi:hypothetical protein